MRNVRQTVPQVQLVTFRLGGEEFGLDVFAVHEILRYQEPTAVPRAPAFVEGVMDVRGTLVPVVDLRRRFELARAENDDDTRIVLVEFGGERLGLVVDAVTEVLRVPETAIQPPPRYIKGLAAEFVRGMARLEARLIVLLDMDRILSSEERIALETATLGAAETLVAGGASGEAVPSAGDVAGDVVGAVPFAENGVGDVTAAGDDAAPATEDGAGEGTGENAGEGPARRGSGRSRG